MGKTIYTAAYSAVSWTAARRTALTKALSKQLPAILRDTEADAVAVTGTSGECIGYLLAALDKVPVLVVKKPGVSSHSGSVVRVENEAWAARSHTIHRYLFLDDCIDSGNTRIAVSKALEGVEEVGAVLYSGFTPNGRLGTSVYPDRWTFN